MSPVLRFQLLGDFHVLYDDAPVENRLSSRLQALLAYLIVQRGKPQLRHHVAFALWPDSTEAQARTNLRHLIHSLRQMLPAVDEFLRVDTLALEWCSQPPSSDLAEFEAAIVQAEFERAIVLYRGDLLPSCYDDWIAPERERLRQLFLQALERHILACEQRQEYNAAIVHAQRLLQQDPLRESSYQRIMQLYALAGDRASVTRTFQLCATVLKRELGVEPSEATVEAYEHLLRLEVHFTVTPAPLSATFAFDNSSPQLPVALTSFVGRERAIAAVRALLAPQHGNGARGAAGTRLLTLTGAGGCGKTRLALQVASEMRAAATFDDGVWWVELTSLADPTLVAQSVAGIFAVRESGSRSLTENLIELLRPRQALLLLDNCEHLVAACAELAQALLTGCPRLTILATSREALAIAGETVWLVPSLELPTLAAPVAEIQETEAVKLFVERATAALPTFHLTTHNAAMVAQICRQLDGIPLAIELAAARVKLLSIEQLGRRLAGAIGERFQLLSGGSRTAGRHQTLRAAINWSHDLLPEEERVLFRRLSVFAGGFTLEAAEAVCGDAGSDVLNLLAHLVDKSLVIVEVERQPTGDVRYRMLETLRQFSRERLRAAGEEEIILERHARYYAMMVSAAAEAFNGPDELVWLNRFEAEHDNLREVLHWIEETQSAHPQRGQAAVEMVAVAWKFWAMRGYQRQGFDAINKILAWSGAGQPAPARLRALLGASFLGQELRLYAATAPLLQEALAIAIRLDNKADIATTYQFIGGAAINQGDYAAGRTSIEQSLLIWREMNIRFEIGHALISMALIPLLQNNFAEAQALFIEGIATLRQIGVTNLLAYSLRQLARVYWEQGLVAEAVVACRESLTLNVELKSESGVLASLAEFVGIAVTHGEPAKAARLLGAVDTFLAGSGRELLAIDSDLLATNRARLRSAMTAALFEAAWQQGRMMSVQETVDYVMGEGFSSR